MCFCAGLRFFSNCGHNSFGSPSPMKASSPGAPFTKCRMWPLPAVIMWPWQASPDYSATCPAAPALVRRKDVEIVGEIVGREFPRTIDIPDLRHADDLDPAGAVEDDVEIPAQIAEPVFQAVRLRVPGREDQAVIHAKLRHLDQSELVVLQLAFAVMAFRGDGHSDPSLRYDQP